MTTYTAREQQPPRKRIPSRIEPGGYRYGEQHIREHVLIAERALGHPLPAKAQVHHFNGNRADNRNCNLVVCEDQAYHALLHRRAKAKKACGNPSWEKCAYCRNYDDPRNVTVRMVMGRHQAYHPYCRSAYERNRKLRKQGHTVISALRTA